MGRVEAELLVGELTGGNFPGHNAVLRFLRDIGWTFDADEVKTLADEATPSVLNGRIFKSGGTTPITDFDDGVVGQEITILAEHSITITDGSPIVLNGGGNYTMTDSDTLTLRMFNDQIWHETARSVN